jgi:hypothetical protein
MPVLVGLIGLTGILAGIAMGWYLRSVNAWCPQCGAAVSCTACGRRPQWSQAGADHHA